MKMLTATLRIALAAASLATLSSSAFAAPIPTIEAGTHIGESVIVTGIAAQVSTMNGGVTFINFGQRHPNSEFTVVIRPGDKDFGDLKRFEWKQVEAEG
jgi:hypothetical protein